MAVNKKKNTAWTVMSDSRTIQFTFGPNVVSKKKYTNCGSPLSTSRCVMNHVKNMYRMPHIGANGISLKRTGILPRTATSMTDAIMFALCCMSATGRRRPDEPLGPFMLCGHSAYLTTTDTSMDVGAATSNIISAALKAYL
mmetsp:Transcript_14068/g.21368  ORF Transcript_14068/g.21368 Transcript_14068/m.21368 type:complete len:141 (-) Transcript_14068:648-1070(-)